MTPSTGMRNGLPNLVPGQSGFSLIVALIMLIVIIILGISSSQMAVNEERGARNNRDRQLAFQAAEAALKDAEYEILGAASPPCGNKGQDHGRQGSPICFNESSGAYFVSTCNATPSFAQGLCDSYNSVAPAYLSSNVNFYLDASGNSGSGVTVQYGTFTHATYPSQANTGMGGYPISRYPPRYIIERVPKNVAVAYSLTNSGGGVAAASAGGTGPVMFRITAMGFGANPNSQVVLQSIVSTQD